MQVFEKMEQGTEEWHKARRCKITGTKLQKVMGTDLTRFELIAELIAEEGTEQTKALKPTMEMERGMAEEIFAIKLFEKQTGKKVTQVGICLSDELDFIALSPDGLIKNEKGKYSEAVEVKSPNSATAIKYKLANMIEPEETKLTASKKPFLGVPVDYKWQMILNFVINPDLKKLYFGIYDERFIDGKMKLYIVEVDRDNEELQKAVVEANEALVKFRATWLNWKEIILPTNF